MRRQLARAEGACRTGERVRREAEALRGVYGPTLGKLASTAA